MKTRTIKFLTCSALAAALVTLTSCRVENISGIESVFQDVTGSASPSMVTHLASAAHSSGNSTEDFTDGFKAGYAAGYAEAANLAVATPGCDHGDCDDCDHHGEEEEIVYRKPNTVSHPASNYGVSSYPAKSSSSGSSYSRTRSSSRRCAGGS